MEATSFLDNYLNDFYSFVARYPFSHDDILIPAGDKELSRESVSNWLRKRLDGLMIKELNIRNCSKEMESL